MQGKSLAAVAQAHNKSVQDLANALKSAAHTRIDQAVTAGRLTTDQANQQKTQVDARIDQQINQVMRQGGPGGRFGPGGPGGPGGLGPERGGFDLNAAASVIGIPADQLRTELQGKSLTDVAQAHNKSVQDVANALKTAAHTRIDQAVTAGRLTTDQANQQKSQVDARIDQLMTQTLPQRGPGRGAEGEAPAV